MEIRELASGRDEAGDFNQGAFLRLREHYVCEWCDQIMGGHEAIQYGDKLICEECADTVNVPRRWGRDRALVG